MITKYLVKYVANQKEKLHNFENKCLFWTNVFRLVSFMFLFLLFIIVLIINMHFWEAK